MRFQVLLSMGQYRLSKEEVGKLLDQKFHVVAMTQDLRHSIGNWETVTAFSLAGSIEALYMFPINV